MRTGMGHLWYDSDVKAGVCREKPVSLPCCPPQIPRWPSQTDLHSIYTKCLNDTLVFKKENLHVRIYYRADVRFALLDAKGNSQILFLYAFVYYSVVTPGGMKYFHTIFDVCQLVLKQFVGCSSRNVHCAIFQMLKDRCFWRGRRVSSRNPMGHNRVGLNRVA